MKLNPILLTVAAVIILNGASTVAALTPVTGADTTLAIQSKTLRETREILVALPNDYDESNERYPVVYVLDAGWHFLPAVAAARVLAETSYISAHRIPPVILVGIINRDRNEDNTPTRCVSQHGMSFPTSGGADAFLTFMENELVPMIDEQFRTQPYRVLCGWSLGGLLTMYALIERPDIFGGHIAISPSLWWDEQFLVDRASELAASGKRRELDLVLTIGTEEEGGLCHTAVNDLVDRWRGAPLPGLSFSFIEIDGEDHNHSPYKAYFDGLRTLFADWFYPEKAFAEGLDSLQRHYAALSKRRGYTIGIPDHMYAALARDCLADERPDDAVAVLEAKCATDVRSAESFYELGEICRAANYDEKALEAYLRALEIERESSAPDTVFINWVERIVTELKHR